MSQVDIPCCLCSWLFLFVTGFIPIHRPKSISFEMKPVMFSKNCSLLGSVSQVFVGTASSTHSSEQEQRLLGWLLPGLLQASPWGEVWSGGAGGEQKSHSAHHTLLTALAAPLLYSCCCVPYHSLVSLSGEETDVFKPQETKNTSVAIPPLPFYGLLHAVSMKHF